jgi:hypothetical protein
VREEARDGLDALGQLAVRPPPRAARSPSAPPTPRKRGAGDVLPGLRVRAPERLTRVHEPDRDRDAVTRHDRHARVHHAALVRERRGERERVRADGGAHRVRHGRVEPQRLAEDRVEQREAVERCERVRIEWVVALRLGRQGVRAALRTQRGLDVGMQGEPVECPREQRRGRLVPREQERRDLCASVSVCAGAGRTGDARPKTSSSESRWRGSAAVFARTRSESRSRARAESTSFSPCAASAL